MIGRGVDQVGVLGLGKEGYCSCWNRREGREVGDRLFVGRFPFRRRRIGRRQRIGLGLPWGFRDQELVGIRIGLGIEEG